MARIRTIKPEFWSSEQIVECSPIARLLFVGLWNFADDAGVIPRRPRTIKMQVFPGDDCTVDDVENWLAELEMARLVGRFTAENVEYLAVTGWHHQKIERPTYRYPKPPENLKFDDISTNTHRGITEASPPEGKGREGKGEDGNGKEDNSCSEASSEPLTSYQFPVVGDKSKPTWTLTESLLTVLRESYPGVNHDTEIRKAVAWCVTHPTQRKTANGMAKFLNSWLGRAQDRVEHGPGFNGHKQTAQDKTDALLQATLEAKQRLENDRRLQSSGV